MATTDTEPRPSKPVFWIASSRKDLKKFPKSVRQTIGQALFDAQTYESWQEGPQRSAVDVPGARTWEDVRASGVYQVLTPDETVALGEAQGGAGSVLLHPLMGGISPELGWESLELFQRAVLPRLRPGS